MNLADLYKEEIEGNCNPDCVGCSILLKDKAFHCYEDYNNLEESEVLVVMDCFKQARGTNSPFKPLEKAVLDKFMSYPYVATAAVKCPYVKETDLKTEDRKICRKHLDKTLNKVKPKLVFACGNLAFKMLTKKSGITKKRGMFFEETTPEGHTFTVVPIYHPFAVYKEPSHESLFAGDINTAIEKILKGKGEKLEFTKTFVLTRQQLEKARAALGTTDLTISVDTETTGLNFLTANIRTVSISYRLTNGDINTWVFPALHKDSPFVVNGILDEELIKVLTLILENPNNRKVFHNAKFDLKMLFKHNIFPINVWDTQLMHHFVDETAPNSLSDLVRRYFPLENFITEA